MKDKIIKAILVILITAHAVTPLMRVALYGADSATALLLDIYDHGIVVFLSAAVLRLYNAKK